MSPRAPTTRSELIYLLSEAAELEHSLACQYLFTAFTLKQPGDRDVSEDRLATLRTWGDTIRAVAVQEMLHLTLACNLLSAVGAAPNLRRPPFPQSAKFYSEGLRSALAPFSVETLARYLCWERPAEAGWWDDACRGEARADAPDPAPGADADGLYPHEPSFRSIVELYQAIEAGFDYLDRRGPLFIGPAAAQVTADDVVFAHRIRPAVLRPIAVRTLADARRAIELIIREGEGGPTHTGDCHFAHFARLHAELKEAITKDPSFHPARPVIQNPVFGFHGETLVPGAQIVTDPLARRVGAVFTAAYDLMLQMLMRTFARTGETPGQTRTLMSVAVGLMSGVIQPLGTLLTGMPAGERYPGRTAGPSFELYRDVQPLPHGPSAWCYFDERLGQIAQACRAISEDAEALFGLAAIADFLLGMDDFRVEATATIAPGMEGGASAAPGLAAFVGLSALLTGYRPDDLAPPAMPDGVAEEHFRTVREGAGVDVVDRLLSAYLAIVAASGGERAREEQGVSDRILADPVLSPVARRIVRLWYLAAWYDDEPPTGAGRIVSAAAYTKSLAWRAIGAHPMGYSELPYGHWAVPPPADEVPS